MSDHQWSPGTRICWLCQMPTGHDGRTCPLCERVLLLTAAVHRGENRTPAEPRAHEERIRRYERRADEKRPLFD